MSNDKFSCSCTFISIYIYNTNHPVQRIIPDVVDLYSQCTYIAKIHTRPQAVNTTRGTNQFLRRPPPRPVGSADGAATATLLPLPLDVEVVPVA